jgi:hypothetical protein
MVSPIGPGNMPSTVPDKSLLVRYLVGSGPMLAWRWSIAEVMAQVKDTATCCADRPQRWLPGHWDYNPPPDRTAPGMKQTQQISEEGRDTAPISRQTRSVSHLSLGGMEQRSRHSAIAVRGDAVPAHW